MTAKPKTPGRNASSRYGPVNPRTGRRTLLPCPKCAKKSCECLELKVMALWEAAGLPTPAREVVFAHPARKWRADFGFFDARVLVEIDGRGGGGGRHATAVGYRADCEKINCAILLGWKVIRLTDHHLTQPKGGGEPYAVRVVRAAITGDFTL
jgi:hypothetical protein